MILLKERHNLALLDSVIELTGCELLKTDYLQNN